MVVKIGGRASQCLLLSLAYKAFDILMRLDFADCEIGAELIAVRVAAFIFSGIAFGPSACVAHVGEKWSLIFAQHGHMNQCDALVVVEEDRDEPAFCFGDCFWAPWIKLAEVVDEEWLEIFA